MVNIILKHAAKRAGTKYYPPHDWRRSGVTGFRKMGVPWNDVKKILGNSSDNMVFRYDYTRNEPKSLTLSEKYYEVTGENDEKD